MGKKVGVLLCWVGLTFCLAGLVWGDDYKLRAGDVLNLRIWVDGNQALQAQEIPVRPDGKIALSVNYVSGGADYRLEPGDVLGINVYGYPELQVPEMLIRPDGKFSYPLIGEVSANGMKPAELAATMSTSLSEYIKNPQVTVNVVKFRTAAVMRELNAAGLTLDELTRSVAAALAESVKEPKVVMDIAKFGTIRVYVLGEVAKPGLMEIEREHTFMDAIALAGGYTRFASRKNVYIVHKATSQYLQVNLDNILKKGDLSQNYELGEGDVVYLARNGMSYIQDILPIINGIYDVREILKP